MAKLTFLKKNVDRVKSRTARYYLHQYHQGYDPARPLINIHASELTKPDFCPRYYALAGELDYKPPNKWLTTSEQITFRMGRDHEKNIVMDFANMGRAYCHWECKVCGHVEPFQLLPDDACTGCGRKVLHDGTPVWKPKEPRAVSTKTGASCGLDMVLNLDRPLLVIHEVKTMDKDEFKALKGPLAEHRERTNFYMRIVDEADESEFPWKTKIDLQEAWIIYTTKGGYGCIDPSVSEQGITEKFTPFKEYKITRDDKATNHLAKAAKQVTDYRLGKGGMPEGICAHILDKNAAGCGLKKPCFSGNYPVGKKHAKNPK